MCHFGIIKSTDARENVLFGGMLSIYKEQDSLSSDYFGSDKKETHASFQRFIQDGESNAMVEKFVEQLQNMLSKNVFSKTQPTREYTQLTKSMLVKIQAESDFINILDFFDVNLKEIAFNPLSLPNYISWSMVRVELQRAFTQSDARQIKKALRVVLQSFRCFGWNFDQEFIHHLNLIVVEKRGNQRGACLDLHLAQYKCFRVKTPVLAVQNSTKRDHDADYWDDVRLKIMKTLNDTSLWEAIRNEINQEGYVFAQQFVKEVEEVIFRSWYTGWFSTPDDLMNVLNRWSFRKPPIIYTGNLGFVEVGSRVVVKNDFVSNMSPPVHRVHLRKGQCGQVVKIDDDGDIYVKFLDYQKRQWVCGWNFVNLAFENPSKQQNTISLDDNLDAGKFVNLESSNGFYCEYTKPLSAPNFEGDVDIPEGSIKLYRAENKKYDLVLKSDFHHFRHCLLELVNPHYNRCNNPVELPNLMQDNMKRKRSWQRILSEIKRIVEIAVSISDIVDMEKNDASDSVCSFSIELVKIIHRDVKKFLRTFVQEEFVRIGLEFDMDVLTILHYFALLWGWKTLCKAQRYRSMHNVRELENQKAEQKAYFVHTICSNPKAASEAAARKFMKTLVANYNTHEKSRIAQEIQADLETEEFSQRYSAENLQDQLHDQYLFSNNAVDGPQVVQIFTDLHTHVTAEFKTNIRKDFEFHYDPQIEAYKTNFCHKLKALETCVKSLMQQLEDRELQEKPSSEFFGSIQENLNSDSPNAAAYEFFLNFCQGTSIGDGIGDIQAMHEASIVEFMDTGGTSSDQNGVPLLYNLQCSFQILVC